MIHDQNPFIMRLCSSILTIYVILRKSLYVTSFLRDEVWLLRNVFMHQDLPLCSHVALTPGYLTPCHVKSAEDGTALSSMVNKNCGNNKLSISKTFCSPCDGSFDKTCMPQSVSPDRMFCACSILKSTDYNGDDMTWTGWWSSLASPYTGLYREMCDTTSGECLAKEYRLELTFLSKHLDLQPSAFSASSEFNNDHAAYKVRADIKDIRCAWVSAVYSASWVQFDLGRPHVAIGVFFSKRCDKIKQYVVSFTLTGSNDGSVWTTPGDAIYVNYNDNLNGTHWFDAPLPSRRLWRITVVEERSGTRPSVWADLIGYITD